VGAEAAATLLLIGVLLTPASLRAHEMQEPAASAAAPASGTLVFRSALERDLANEVMCTCGCRLPAGTCGMTNCEGKASQLAKIKTLVDEGKDRDAVLASFVQEFGGQHILARPLDEGYHKLLWLLPYTLAGLSALGLAFIARRWAAGRSDIATAGASAAVAGVDPSLRQQLDDELRDLD
jgi:hypothetical protein